MVQMQEYFTPLSGKKMVDESGSLCYANGIPPYPVIPEYSDNLHEIKYHGNNLARMKKNPMSVTCG